MGRTVVPVLVLVACNSLTGVHTITPKSHDDAGADGVLDGVTDVAADAPFCLTPHLGIKPLCVPPSGAVMLSQNIDTAVCSQVLTPTKGPEQCVISGTTLTVQDGIRVTGPRTLILLAEQSISVPVGSELDASSHNGRGGLSGAGPGADHFNCLTASGSDAADATQGGGGGAGGSLQGGGGAGGSGNGAAGGSAGIGYTTPVELDPGCAGGAGGKGSAGGTPGAGGYGGGAVYLIAGQWVDIGGAILASGAGGYAGQTGSETGGGGGGAGGMIVLEAPTVTVSGFLLASGAGGGGGTDGTLGSASVGFEPDVVSATSAANGGAGGGSGGSGGPGSSTTLTGGAGVSTSCMGCGGGGGGGAAGFIAIFAATSMFTGTLVPPPSLNP